MNDVKRHRRLHNRAAWFLAFFPWSLPALVIGVNAYLDDEPLLNARIGAMIGLCAACTIMIVLGWKPWKKEE